ncbi:tetratricopeptide repeat protein [Acidocella aromatica]|uniref:Tetratricopeptide (TPR) repeat protein n=1 Tax=Acidocella aromatica TaxID=1303579 RepID=A0A840VD15_9PROT|nr:tetratricopeptide repeat protein [Acidocella aromatica]MBB5372747.1 tetratricopeptide (TPR) repeat protein [Acidocella aromatica]
MSNDVKPAAEALERQVQAEQILASEPANVGALVELGRSANAQGDHGAALRAFAAAAVLQPQDIWRWLDVAGALVALGRMEAAEDAYSRILLIKQDQPQALIGLGRCARTRHAHDEALAVFQRVAELVPHDMWRWLDVGDELIALNRLDDAEAAFQRAAIVAPDTMAPFLRLGRCARQRGAREVALAAFQRAAQLAPRDMWRWLDVGEELTVLGRLAEAESAFRHAVEVAPGQKLPVERLGACLAASGGPAAELAYYQDYANRNPDDLWGRRRVAALLRMSGRLDEAETLCRDTLREEPENADTLLELGLCARQRRNHDEAVRLFREAVRLAPEQLWPRQQLAQELRTAGAYDDALAEADEALRRYPDALAALLGRAQCLRDGGRYDDALAAYEAIAAKFPNDNGVLVELAAVERRLGRHEAASAHLTRVLEREPVNVAAVKDLGGTALLLGDFAEAYRLFSSAAEAKPDEPAFQMGVIDTLAAVGEVDDAISRLEALERQQGPLAGLRVKRAALLRQTGRYHEAVALARASTALGPENFWLWFERFFCEMQVGPGSAVAECLARMPVSGVREYAMRQRCRGLYAESRLMYGTARHYYREAEALAPEDTAPYNDLVRTGFITLQLDDALAQLRRVGELDASNNKLLGRALNVSQTHYGQILDEYRMDQAVAAKAVRLWQCTPRERLPRLRELVREAPDNTALAVTLLLSLRQCGALRGPLVPGGVIPRVIYQFWDSAVPPDIQRLMRSWQALNPGWEVRLFDDRQAREMLAQTLPPAVLAAYRRCAEPAQRADLFRLALLALHGGVYADADDRCLRPLDEFLPEGAELVLYQEDLGTLGNNFLAVAPGHPVVLRALDQAVDAINRGDTDIVWLATGPALISRVVASWLAQSSALPPGLVVFDRREAFQAIGMHCAAGYKRAGRHWLETSFSKRGGRPQRGAAA